MVISMVGCNNKQEGKEEGSDAIAEAQITKDDGNKNNNSSNATEQPIASIEPGEKVEITEDIKNKVLALAPGLTDYRVGEKLNDQMKFRFVYYGYSSEDLSRYTKKDIKIEGTTNTWALVPKADVESKFKEVFGVDLGEYRPTLNEDDPTVYFANDYYYICTSSEKDNVDYSLLKEGDSVVKIKEVYEGAEDYNELNVTLQTANNTNGFIITKVLGVPK